MWKKWIIAFTLSSPAWGFNLTQDFINGFYWAELPIKISISETNPARKNKIETLATEAIDEWQKKTGLSLWSLDGTQGTNVIRWSTNFAAETKMDPNSVLAVAIRYTDGPYFARTEIVINGSHYLNSDMEHLYTTITHELGHTMGLDHSSEQLAVMAPTLQDPYLGLNHDDIKGMKEVNTQTTTRQTTNYISPLAFEKSETKSEPLSCGTIGAVNQPGFSFNSMGSLSVGLLMAFVRKLIGWFKSLLK